MAASFTFGQEKRAKEQDWKAWPSSTWVPMSLHRPGTAGTAEAHKNEVFVVREQGRVQNRRKLVYLLNSLNFHVVACIIDSFPEYMQLQGCLKYMFNLELSDLE